MILVMLLIVAAQANGEGGVVISEARIKDVLTGYVLQKTADMPIEARIKKIGYRGDIIVPPGNISFEVIAPDSWEGWGNATVSLLVRVNDRVEKNLSARLEVEALGDMVVTARPLERGELIKAGDVLIQKRDISTAPPRVCKTLEDAVGKIVKTGIRGNTPIRADYLEKMPVVKNGQAVSIIAENDALCITAPGKAKKDGAAGDTILVVNMNTQKDVKARVIDSKTVSVEF
jgi:flagella basal body P-ring formation protein FlgA